MVVATKGWLRIVYNNELSILIEQNALLNADLDSCSTYSETLPSRLLYQSIHDDQGASLSYGVEVLMTEKPMFSLSSSMTRPYL